VGGITGHKGEIEGCRRKHGSGQPAACLARARDLPCEQRDRDDRPAQNEPQPDTPAGAIRAGAPAEVHQVRRAVQAPLRPGVIQRGGKQTKYPNADRVPQGDAGHLDPGT
jgi:hypothetical protein